MAGVGPRRVPRAPARRTADPPRRRAPGRSGPVFERVRDHLAERGRMTLSRTYAALADAFDLGQRIFQAPFSWKALGIDVQGRSRVLRVNYCTSHQIRTYADRLLEPEISDVDDNREDRTDAVSVFNGPPPCVRLCADENEEIDAVAAWLRRRVEEGVTPDTVGVFVRCDAELPRATRAIEEAGLEPGRLEENVAVPAGKVPVGTMHLAKGLEFSAVAVMACDDHMIPLQERIEANR